MLDQIFGHIETDAARADDRHFRADRSVLRQYIEVAQNARIVTAGKAHRAWRDAGGDHHFVIAASKQRGDVRRLAQLHVDTGVAQLMTEIAQRLVELFLAGNLFGVVELPADFTGAVDQGYRVAALAERAGACHACRAGANHGDAFAHAG